ncbi:hypothetical protein AKI40_pA001 (plasmid) [Enterobacter sp. FY-07]|nr:hypothetical protein AKI40_pA001 [Enterobacter sp. FY-07]
MWANLRFHQEVIHNGMECVLGKGDAKKKMIKVMDPACRRLSGPLCLALKCKRPQLVTGASAKLV